MNLQSASRTFQALMFFLSAIGFILSGSSGGQERVSWTTSKILGTPDPPKPYVVERVYPKLEFQQPVEIMPLDNSGRMIVLELSGKIYTFTDSDECEKADLALDLAPDTPRFGRALGLGVHPDFATNREIFIVYFQNPTASPDGTKLSRFRMTMSDPPTIDRDSEEILLTWPCGGHNGCAIRFDRDGYLYFSAGDGARPYPPDEYNVSQDLSDLRSTICRIDVDHRDGDRAYRIPPDNPFIGIPNARPEVWAFGFRNPWRFSIDPVTQALMCGDVGWELWELIYQVERGGNYGWSIFEGPQMIRSDLSPGPSPIRPPLFAYPHTDGLSVTGGVIYRGNQLDDLKGTYLYGDFVNGKIWGLRSEAGKVTWQQEIANTNLAIITFAQDRQGEILVMSHGGTIHRLIKNPEPDRSSDFPGRLSETGLFQDTTSLQPSPGVVPYRLRVNAFEDNATSEYWIGIPGEASIELKPQKRQWVYPKNTVFAKTISIPLSNAASGLPRSQRVESQILHFDGLNWNPYSYVWNNQQTDADLVSKDGMMMDTPKKTWRIHSRSECLSCHNSPSGTIAGWDFANLTAPSCTSEDRNQLEELERLGMVKGITKLAKKSNSMAPLLDPNASLETRARSYLSINCAHCHCRGGGGTVALELPFATPTDKMNAIDQLPTQGNFGIENARVIVSGDPYRSVLYYRLATNGAGHMPKLWSRENDSEGIKTVHDWIATLERDDEVNAKSKEIAGHDLVQNGVTVTESLHRFHAFLAKRVSTTEQEAFLASIKKDADPVVRGLFERFLPASERVKRLGSQMDRNQILALSGDAQKGETSYRESAALQCRNCHRVGSRGQSVGPDLDGIAKKRSREELLESILEPSKRIEAEFQSHFVLTADGQTITGLRVDRTDSTTILRSADGKLHTIANDEIEEARTLGVSLMPAGLAAELTAEELANLLAYLQSLR